MNKSEAVRQYMTANPEAGPKKIADALKSLKISANYVSTVKNKMKSKTTKGSPGRPRASAGAGNHSNMDSLVAAANLIKTSGGVEAAREALTVAAKVVEASSN